MNYEKKYKEALELARVAAFNGHQSLMEGIFPELKESEDERIRKEIQSAIKQLDKDSTICGKKYDYNQWLAWLEKQGEQKPANKIEPKFKVGDFIVNDYCMGKVIKLTDDAYLLDTEQGIPFSCEHNVHLWTIQDAKDGDVLCTPNGNTFIFKTIDGDKILDYCGLYFNKFFSDCGSPNGSSTHYDKCNYHPATKEQRDFLFQKMKESGYEWNSENKELKKISQRMISAEAKEAMYDKTASAWGEEDEKMVANLVDYFNVDDALQYTEKQVVDWLKSLKDRIQPKTTWKPSDEQIVVLELASKYERVFTPKQIDILIGLKEQLKKLKGE